MASVVCPTETDMAGCCVPEGSWLMTDETLALISVIAASAL